jgi:uncharacterized protein
MNLLRPFFVISTEAERSFARRFLDKLEMTDYSILMKKILLNLINIYQKTISRDHGPNNKNYPYGHCRFYPSCSEYMKQSIEKRGVINGVLRGIWRIIKCNPCSKGGVDMP